MRPFLYLGGLADIGNMIRNSIHQFINSAIIAQQTAVIDPR